MKPWGALCEVDGGECCVFFSDKFFYFTFLAFGSFACGYCHVFLCVLTINPH